MADVFLSYVRSDKDRVRRLIETLRGAGFSVWWDDDIAPDAPWETTIERELSQAKIVIVCWSSAAVLSENVRAEARRARADNRLIQVFIEQCEPPLFFGERQGINLFSDSGTNGGPETDRLIARLRGALATSGDQAVPAKVPPRATDTRRPRIGRRGLLLGGGAGLIVAAGAGGWVLSSRGRASVGSASVAVMPFANLSGDPSQAYFSDGLAEELRSALSRLPGIKVTARTSSEKLRDDDAVDAARRLGVDHILTGSVRRTPTLIRVNAQLVDGATGMERWSQSYDRAPGDTLSIQTGVAQNVAQALSVALGLQSKEAIAAGGTTNAEAHDLFLKASELYSTISNEADVRQTLALLDQALAIDQLYASAHILRARALAWLAGTYAHSAAESQGSYSLAANAARRAIALAPSLPGGHACLASIFADQLHVKDALRQYQRAAALGADVGFLRSYSVFLARLGRADEAVALSAKAVSLDPLNANTISDQAWVFFMGRRYAEAIAAGRRTLVLAPGQNQAHYIVGASFLLMGQRRKASAELSQLPPDNPTRLTLDAVMAAQAGDRASSDRAFARLEQIGHDSSNFQYAEIYSQRGEIDLAISALGRAWAARDPGLLGLRIAPFLDPLRADPRFAALEAKLDFP